MKMKRTFSQSLALLPLAAACTLLGTAAQAQLITINGKVTNATCSLSIVGGNTIQMPTATNDKFPTVGETTGETPFKVSVTNCGASPGVTAKVHFYGNTSNVSNGRIAPALANAGWQLQLLPPTGNQQIWIGTDSNYSNQTQDPGASIATGNAEINLFGSDSPPLAA